MLFWASSVFQDRTGPAWKAAVSDSFVFQARAPADGVFFPLKGVTAALKHPLALIQDYCEKYKRCYTTETAIFLVLWWLLSSLYYIFCGIFPAVFLFLG